MLNSYQYVSAWMQVRLKTDRGASLVEYALLVALIAVVCMVAVGTLGKTAEKKFTEINDEISTQDSTPEE